jgi:hypothetical protein
MANQLAPSFKKLALDGDIDLLVDDIRVVATDSGYTFSAAHNFLDDVPSGNRNGVSASLTGKDTTDGVFDAEDTTITAANTDQITGLWIYKHTGVDSTSPLICWIDTATGLPFTPAASQVMNVLWSNGADKIFEI